MQRFLRKCSSHSVPIVSSITVRSPRSVDILLMAISLSDIPGGYPSRLGSISGSDTSALQVRSSIPSVSLVKLLDLLSLALCRTRWHTTRSTPTSLYLMHFGLGTVLASGRAPDGWSFLAWSAHSAFGIGVELAWRGIEQSPWREEDRSEAEAYKIATTETDKRDENKIYNPTTTSYPCFLNS